MLLCVSVGLKFTTVSPYKQIPNMKIKLFKEIMKQKLYISKMSNFLFLKIDVQTN